jgi:hypothetical protein
MTSSGEKAITMALCLDLENSFDAAMLALSILSKKTREADEMKLYYASNRAWHELDAARLSQKNADV